MTKAIAITWTQHGETRVTLSNAFNDLPWIDRADCLKDAIFDLEQEYAKVMAEMDKFGKPQPQAANEK